MKLSEMILPTIVELTYLKDDARFTTQIIYNKLEQEAKKQNYVGDLKQLIDRELSNLYKNNSIGRYGEGKYIFIKKKYIPLEIEFKNYSDREFENSIKTILIDQNYNAEDFIKSINTKFNTLESSIHSLQIEGNTISSTLEYNNRKEQDIEKIEVESYKNVLDEENSFFSDENINLYYLRSLHQRLNKDIVNTTRFTSKEIGIFKTKNNYISSGYQACSPEQTEIELQKWINSFNTKPKSAEDALGRVMALHIWFEQIHPFADGNGRIGRALNGIYLKMHGYSEKVNADFTNIMSKKSYIELLNKFTYTKQNLLETTREFAYKSISYIANVEKKIKSNKNHFTWHR